MTTDFSKYGSPINSENNQSTGNTDFSKYGTPVSQTQTNQLDGFANISKPADLSFKNLVKPTVDLATGAAKGAASTLQNIGNLALKPLNYGLNKLGIDTPKTGFTKEELTPTNTTQSIGKGAEQFAEYFIPAGAASKAELTLDTLTKGLPKIVGAVTRIAGKSAIQGVTAGAVNLAQTGDINSALDTAKTAGVVRGGFATIGEGARAIKLPERLYSTIFKNTSSDMMQELRTESIAQLKNDNPEKYAEFIKQGIIKESANGTPVINETIAKQALDAGLKGSIRNMAKTVVYGALDSESQVQNAVKNYSGTVNLGEKQSVSIYSLLKDMSKEYQDVGFNEISDEANRLASIVNKNNGQILGEDALSIRRLLDKARIARSFDNQASKLSLGQQNLKTISDYMRGKVNEIPGVGEVMKKYSFYIDAMDTLAKEAARRGNNQAISLIDSLFLSSAYGGNNAIPGLTIGMLRRILMSGAGITNLGQILNKSAASAGAIGTTGAITGSLMNQ